MQGALLLGQLYDLSSLLGRHRAYVNKGGGDDDAGTKIFRHEKSPFWDANPSMSSSVDGEACTYANVSERIIRRMRLVEPDQR